MAKNVLEWLESSARKYPEKTAYESEGIRITFSQVKSNAQKIGSGICKSDTGSRPIATLLDRDANTISAYLGIVYSGHAYAPIDSTLPDNRILDILKILNPAIILTNYKHEKKIESLIVKSNIKCQILKYEDLIFSEIDENILSQIRKSMVSSEPLYVIFTSGSSGVPKGVITSHASLINYIEAYAEMMSINCEDRIGSQSPLDYIAAIRDIYLPLYKNAYSYIIPKELFMQPSKLIKVMNDKKITCIGWSASALSVLSKIGIFKEDKFIYLKKVCFSGSAIPTKVLREWQVHLPTTFFVNQYGPTEATASCTYYRIDHIVEENEDILIGIPYNNYKVFLLKEDNSLAKSGELGEICIGGPVLALGYYGDKERTRNAFVQNPLQVYYDDRIYRTGDIGRYNQDGLLEYHGRLDRQIKHLGHRVELDDIECSAMRLTAIDEVAVIYEPDKEIIFLFYVGGCSEKDVIIGLRKGLPGFMVPRKVIKMDEIPKLPNGKFDFNKLKEWVKRSNVYERKN